MMKFESNTKADEIPSESLQFYQNDLSKVDDFTLKIRDMTQSYSETRARGKARELLQRGFYGDPKEIDVQVLVWDASQNSLEIEDAGLEGAAHGRIVVGPTGGVIRLNGNLTPRRRRFVLAHELGHYLLHRDQASGFLDSDTTLTQYAEGHIETEANWFASELLLPRDLFCPRIKELKPTIASSSHLADQFQVSQLSTLMQFVTYSPECCALVFSHQGKPRWFRRSKPWEQSAFFINMPQSLPKGSHALEVFDGRRASGTPQKVSASVWLDRFRWEDKAMIWEDVLSWPSLDMMVSLLWVEEDI